MKIISCPHCDMKYRIDPAKFQQDELQIRCKKCGEAFTASLSEDAPAPPAAPEPEPQAAAPTPPTPAPEPQVQTPPAPAPEASAPATESDPGVASDAGSGLTVLIAHESDELRQSMTAILESAGFSVIGAANGIDALMIIEQQKPSVAVLDVALPKMFGFEICEVVRRDNELDVVKILLIAAIYDKTRYKRTPTSLYGADDYIEKHHIPDSLADKCVRLGRGDNAPVREEQTSQVLSESEEADHESQREQIRETEIAETQVAPAPATTPVPAAPQSHPDVDQKALERARRLARTIVSDIALYNQEKIEEGIRGGNLREVLAAEIAEGRQLFDERIADEVQGLEPYLDTAIDQFIETKKQELGV